MEQFSNSAYTNLTSTITSGGTAVVVTDATNFPTTGNFRIIIDNEIMLVTGVSGDTFTVTRGIEGTTAVAHYAGTTVSHILTAGSIQALLNDATATGLLAARPAAGLAGRFYLASDSDYIYRDNGSSWDLIGPLYYMENNIPTSSMFNVINQGNTVATDTNDGLFIRTTNNGTEQATLFTRTIPSTPCTLIAGIKITKYEAQNNFCGLCIRNSSSGWLYKVGWLRDSGYSLQVRKMNGPNNGGGTANISTTSSFFDAPYPIAWLKIQMTGTNRNYFMSDDAEYWHQFATDTASNNFVADEWGLCVWTTGGSTQVAQMKCVYYKEQNGLV